MTRGSHAMFTLPQRLEQYTLTNKSQEKSGLVCECELITVGQIENALDNPDFTSLDDLRRELRLGMGPCQAAFCAYRTTGIAARKKHSDIRSGFLADFLDERWKGLRPLAWGNELRQLDFMRRIYLELLGEKIERNLS